METQLSAQRFTHVYLQCFLCGRVRSAIVSSTSLFNLQTPELYSEGQLMDGLCMWLSEP